MHKKNLISVMGEVNEREGARLLLANIIATVVATIPENVVYVMLYILLIMSNTMVIKHKRIYLRK